MVAHHFELCRWVINTCPLYTGIGLAIAMIGGVGALILNDGLALAI